MGIEIVRVKLQGPAEKRFGFFKTVFGAEQGGQADCGGRRSENLQRPAEIIFGGGCLSEFGSGESGKIQNFIAVRRLGEGSLRQCQRFRSTCIAEIQPGEVLTYYGYVKKGFGYPLLKFVVLSETDIFGAEKKKKKARLQ